MNWRTEKTILSTVAALLMLTTAVAHACRPQKNFGVYFPHNSATVPAYQVKRMAEWMTELREQYPNHQSIYVSGSGEVGEHDAARLGLKRAHNVARILQENFQFKGDIDVTKIGGVEEPASEYLKKMTKSEGVYGVQLDFLPACPHECPCQR